MKDMKLPKKLKKKKPKRNPGESADFEDNPVLGLGEDADQASKGKLKRKSLNALKRKNTHKSPEIDATDDHEPLDHVDRKVVSASEEAPTRKSVSRTEKKKRLKKKVDCDVHLSHHKDDDCLEHGGKLRKSGKRENKKDHHMLPEGTAMRGESEENEVYQMSSGDEDSSTGMKKWIAEYHQNRPGLKVLQEKIDEFITAHEAQEEQARKEREAKAAEGGWTVVVHHKGRKKTTDSESGVAVGSIAQAAVVSKMDKKKNKEVGVDFYRFQRREAHRNEIMMLQSKFEQDKQRIQQLRASRKFRPY